MKMITKKALQENISFGIYSLKTNLINAAENRVSMSMSIIFMVLNNSGFVFLWWYFSTVMGEINGWKTYDILLMSAISVTSYGTFFVCTHGLAKLQDHVDSGALDSFLLSPKNELVRVATSSMNTAFIGDIVTGVICFILWYIAAQASLYTIPLFLVLTLCASLIFFGFTLLTISIAFVIPDAQSISRALFELFISPSVNHGGAIQGGLRVFFIVVIPSLLISAIPTEVILFDAYEYIPLIILLTLFWVVISIKCFYRALRNYESANFITFG